MNVDRRIEFGLSLSERGSIAQQNDAPPGQTGQQRPMPDAQDTDRFASALANRAATTDVSAAPSPFTLLGAPAHSPGGHRPDSQHDWPLAGQIGQQVERLMVSDGTDGKRQVRMDLKDDALPGVTIAIEERDGRLQVDFFCALEQSRRKLTQTLPELAATLATRLRRDVLMRVQTDDEDDPCLTEQLGTA